MSEVKLEGYTDDKTLVGKAEIKTEPAKGLSTSVGITITKYLASGAVGAALYAAITYNW